MSIKLAIQYEIGTELAEEINNQPKVDNPDVQNLINQIADIESDEVIRVVNGNEASQRMLSTLLRYAHVFKQDKVSVGDTLKIYPDKNEFSFDDLFYLYVANEFTIHNSHGIQIVNILKESIARLDTMILSTVEGVTLTDEQQKFLNYCHERDSRLVIDDVTNYDNIKTWTTYKEQIISVLTSIKDVPEESYDTIKLKLY